MPFPMNSTAKRFGSGLDASAGLPQAANDSIQGSAIVTPMPRSTVRREMLIRFTYLIRRATLFRRRQKLHARRRRHRGEHARWFEPSVPGIDAADEHRVRVLIADG